MKSRNITVVPTTVRTARKRKKTQSNIPKLQMLLSTAFHKTTKKIQYVPGTSEQERRRRWIAACRLESFNVTRHTRICSKHFEGGLGPTKANPVPTIFDFPDFRHIRFFQYQLSRAESFFTCLKVKDLLKFIGEIILEDEFSISS